MRRIHPGKMPDPARATGAWVYLATSALAGALTAIGRGALPALLAGLGFGGLFLTASAAAVGFPRGARRLAVGAPVAVGAAAAALLAGADPAFLAYGTVALFPAALSAWFAERSGFQSPAALAFGVAAVVVAAPSAACAGGTEPRLGWLLLALLAPFFAWRTYRLRRKLSARKGWDRAQLRRLGFREAGYTVLWTGLAVAVVHLAG